MLCELGVTFGFAIPVNLVNSGILVVGTKCLTFTPRLAEDARAVAAAEIVRRRIMLSLF
jgi:hypothetical protein